MPKLITSKEILRSSVSFSKRDRRGYLGGRQKSKEVRVIVYFPEASVAGVGNLKPVGAPHRLGAVPQSWTHVPTSDPDASMPGTVFTVFPWASRTKVYFCCTVAGTTAEIVLR